MGIDRSNTTGAKVEHEFIAFSTAQPRDKLRGGTKSSRPGCTVTGAALRSLGKADFAWRCSILRADNRVKSVLNGVTTYYIGNHFEWSGFQSIALQRVGKLRYQPGAGQRTTTKTPWMIASTAFLLSIIRAASQTLPALPLPESAPPCVRLSTTPHAGRSRAAPASRACAFGSPSAAKPRPNVTLIASVFAL